MLRVGFLPSDFNPMLLILGEAEDLRLLAGVLRRFARELSDVRLDQLGFSISPHTAVTMTATVGGATVSQTLALSAMTTAATGSQTLNFNTLGVSITLTGSGASATQSNLQSDLVIGGGNDTIVTQASTSSASSPAVP